MNRELFKYKRDEPSALQTLVTRLSCLWAELLEFNLDSEAGAILGIQCRQLGKSTSLLKPL